MGDLYEMVRAVHKRLPTFSGAPDLRLLADEYLKSIDAALVGSKVAVAALHSLVRNELQRRGLSTFMVPLRAVEDYDPLKNKVEI